VRTIGPYAIEGELARGGVGVVYRARDPGLGRDVAVKLLHAGRGAAPNLRRRFQREAEALARLSHPHVVAVHAAGEAAGCPYLVMDLVPGASLQDRLDREGPLPVREAVGLAAKIARALEAVHAAGLLHRDVKPANVLLRAGDRAPLLTDFGLAKDLDSSQTRLSKTGRFLGTPGFWPPEQARGRLSETGPAADVYALGATLYALLTGARAPVRGRGLHGERPGRLRGRPRAPLRAPTRGRPRPRRRRPALPREGARGPLPVR